MNATVGTDCLFQPLAVGGGELGERAVFENLRDDFILSAEGFQHLGIGGPAGFGLLTAGQSHFVKENGADLFGGIEIEFLPRKGVNLRSEFRHPNRKALLKFVQRRTVSGKAGALHIREYIGERYLDVVEQGFLTVVFNFRKHPGAHGGKAQTQQCRVQFGWHIVGQRGGVLCRKFVGILAVGGGIEDICRQHDVAFAVLGKNIKRCKRVKHGFDVEGIFFNGIV